MSVGKDTLYQTENTEVEVKVENLLSEQTYKGISLEVFNEALNINKNFSLSNLNPGEKWSSEINVKAMKDIDPGIYEVKANLFYDSIHTEVSPIDIEIKEVPLDIKMDLSKKEMDREENNSLSIEINNKGKEVLQDIEIASKFSKLFYLKAKEKCVRQIGELRPEESFTMNCEFKSTADASGEYTLNVKTSFKDSVGEHTFDHYKGVKVKEGFGLPGTQTLLIGAVAVLVILILLKKYI